MQQSLYLQQQPTPSHGQMGPMRTNLGAQKLSHNNQQQQQLSSSMNTPGGFNISFQQQQQHQNTGAMSMGLERSMSQPGPGPSGQRSGMGMQQQLSNPLLGSLVDTTDGFSLPSDYMNPVDVHMAGVTGWSDAPSVDPELSDIIEQVIDIESDSMIFGELTSSTPPPAPLQQQQQQQPAVPSAIAAQPNLPVAAAAVPTAQVPPASAPARPPLQMQDISKEKMAITAIQKSLMSFEKMSPVVQSPPAYGLPGYVQQQQQQMTMRHSAPSYAMQPSTGPIGSLNMLSQQQQPPNVAGRKQKLPVQQRRLLNRQQQQQQQQHQQQQQQQPQQQQQQQLLGVLLNESSSANAQSAQLSPDDLQFMDELLNSIPPNMTIPR